MRTAPAIVWILPALLGCNSLTGANDLEPVDCIDCPDSAVVDSAQPDTYVTDTQRDTEAPDTNIEEASIDTGADTRPACTSDPECDDGNACTTDRCSLFAKTCRNDVIDRDGDGEAASSLGECGLDCNDADKNVFSTQTMYFPTPYATSSTMMSYDYNCDSKNEQESTQLYRCTLTGGLCVLGSIGWVSTVPACGATGKWATACARAGTLNVCIPNSMDKVQACR